MSTNYYVTGYPANTQEPQNHIGKAFSMGHGETGWIWAMEPSELMFLVQIGCTFMDEYDVSIYGTELLQLINDHCVADYSSIGVDFS